MKKYHKINTVFHRDPDNKFRTLLEGEWSEPEFEFLKDCQWDWTEKVDGTNIRVIYTACYQGEKMISSFLDFRGKTDKAQIPADLSKRLPEMFALETFNKAFRLKSSDEEVSTLEVTLYGEGYGNKIQKVGSKYLPNSNSFILFDVKVGETWLDRDDVVDIASNLGIRVVPVYKQGTLMEAIDQIKNGDIIHSIIAEEELPIEGFVLRPSVELRTKTGRRVITKIKYKDFER